MSSDLARLYALAQSDSREGSQKDTRDRASTHLKGAVEEVRAFGRSAFRQNFARRKGYGNAYSKQARRLRKGRAQRDRDGEPADPP